MYNTPNFYNYYPPIARNIPRNGIFKNFFGGVNFNELLNQTSKTLNVINQAIPIIYQIRPLINNTKTIFKIANIIKDDGPSNSKYDNTNINSNKINETKKEELSSSINEPTFFL